MQLLLATGGRFSNRAFEVLSKTDLVCQFFFCAFKWALFRFQLFQRIIFVFRCLRFFGLRDQSSLFPDRKSQGPQASFRELYKSFIIECLKAQRTQKAIRTLKGVKGVKLFPLEKVRIASDAMKTSPGCSNCFKLASHLIERARK